MDSHSDTPALDPHCFTVSATLSGEIQLFLKACCTQGTTIKGFCWQ